MSGFVNDKRYVAPRTGTEKRLVQIWKDALKIGQVGIRDNFFEIGGDSIKAIAILSMMKEEVGKINMHRLFEYQTIEEIAAYFDSVSKTEQNTVQSRVIQNHSKSDIPEEEMDEILGYLASGE